MTANPRIAVVIVNFNGGDEIERSLAALARQTLPAARAIVIDNASTDGSAERVEARFPDVELVRLGYNAGFAAANNVAVRRAEDCELVALLNPDAFPEPTWLETLAAAASEEPGFDAFGSRLMLDGRDDVLDGTGDVYHVSGFAWRRHHESPLRDAPQGREEIFAPCAAAALYRRDAFLEDGGFDEDYFCYLEDVDLGFRMRLRGRRCLYVPDSVVRHVGSSITGRTSAFQIYHSQRNLVWTYVKDMPRAPAVALPAPAPAPQPRHDRLVLAGRAAARGLARQARRAARAAGGTRTPAGDPAGAHLHRTRAAEPARARDECVHDRLEARAWRTALSSPVKPPRRARSRRAPTCSTPPRPEARRSAAARCGSAATASASLLALAAVPLVVRHLGVVDFGRYTLVLSLIALVQGVTEGGLSTVGLREYSVLSERERDDMMRQLLGLRVLLTIAGVTLAVAFTVIAGYDSSIVLGTVVAGVGLLLLVLFNLVSVPLAAELRFGWLTIAEVSRQAVATLLIVVLVIAGAGLVPLLAVQIPAGAVSLVIALVLVRKLIPLRPAFDGGHWWALIRDTLPYAAAIAISAIYFRVTIVLMSLVSNDAQTGYFAASYRVIEVLVGVPLLVVGAAFPIISRAERDDATRLLYASQRTLDMMVIAGIWTTLVVAIAAPFVIDVLAGPKFEPSVETLRIQAVALACTFVSVTCGFMLLALRRHRAILLGNLVPLAFGVTLTLILAPSHGARGAAVATVVAEIGLAVVMLWLVRGHGSGHIPLSLRGIATALLAGLVAAGAGAALLLWVHPLLAALGASLVYAGILLATKQIPPEIAGALRARAAKPR